MDGEDSFVLEHLNSRLSSPVIPRNQMEESIDLGEQDSARLSLRDLEFKRSFADSSTSKVSFIIRVRF